MRGPLIPVNLSREPFPRDRKMLVACSAVAALLFVIIAVEVGVITGERHAARNDRAVLEQLDSQLVRMNADYARLAADLHRPASLAILDRSAFLNQLLQRKGISWTKLFADLTTVTPRSVRIVAVRPYLTGDSQVQLDMIVGSAAPEPVIDLIQRLEHSPQFGTTALLSSQPPSQNEPIYRYRVSVSYAQTL